MHAPGVPSHLLFSCIWEIQAATCQNYWPTSGGHATKPDRLHCVHNEQWVQSESTIVRCNLYIHAINAHELHEHKGSFRVHYGTANALCYAPKVHYKEGCIPDARELLRRPYLSDGSGVGDQPLIRDRLLERSVIASQGFSLPHWQYRGMWGPHNQPK